jgi:hypothetical protein
MRAYGKQSDISHRRLPLAARELGAYCRIQYHEEGKDPFPDERALLDVVLQGNDSKYNEVSGDRA